MSHELRLIKLHRITAILELKSGLHIGAGKDAIEIGGIDSPVVKNPFNQEPYIPGSSVKGKLRSLLEWALDCVENDGGVWGSDQRGVERGKYLGDDPVLRIFGATHKEWHKTFRPGPTRLSVRDAALDPVWAQRINQQGLSFTEEKLEVSIDRIQGKARDGMIRRTERVPAGARFELEMTFKVFDWNGDGGKTDQGCLNRLLEGLKLLEQDALGGSGSRGYGRVRVLGLKVDDVDIQEKFNHLTFDPKQPTILIGA